MDRPIPGVDIFTTQLTRNAARIPDVTLRTVVEFITIAEIEGAFLCAAVVQHNNIALKEVLEIQKTIGDAHRHIVQCVIDELYPQRREEMWQLCRDVIQTGLKLTRKATSKD